MKELFIQERILRYLQDHPKGVSGDQVVAWLQSLRKYSVTIQDAAHGLRVLRDEGVIACANSLWYKRRAA